MATNNKSTPDVDGRTSAAGSSEMLLDFAVSHAPAIFYVASRLGDRPLVFISSNVFDILGYTQEEYLSDSSFGRRLIHPDDLDEYNRSVDGLAETKRASLEYRFRDSSGEYRWFRDEQRYVDDNDKEEFVGCMIDFTGQKEAEGRVSDAEALTATITSATLDALITIESDGCILEFNPAAENIFGYRRDEAVGKNLSELIIPEKHQAAHMKGLADFRYNSRLRHYDRRMEIEARRADGSQFPVELTVSHAALGGRDVLIGSVRDITDRVKSEEERQRLSRLLQDAVESLPHGFSILNEDGIIEAVNSSYAESYGRTVNETIGMDQDENLPAFIAMCQRFDGREVRACPEDITFIKGRMLTSMEIPVEAEMKSGAWWLLVQSNTSEGGYVTLRTDITRQKQAEAAIMESSDMIRRILEACPHPVVMTRLSDGLVIYESPASQQLYGREHIKTDVYSTDIYVNKDDRALYVKQLRKFGQVDGMELKLRQTGGREFWASVSARKIEYQGIECIVASAWDMTESLALDGELTRQREALHQSEKLSALGELLAGVAHELNNPLSVLVGQALLLQETTTDEKIMTRAKKIGNAADRCARIVKTFLAMARQQPMNRRNTQINDVIESALEMTAYGVRSAGIKITTRMAQKLPPVWVDPDQINQVVTNL
ncbi:MAG: PAS domain S-box protein, partial [Rhodospirillales bacterium]|nr:PAS domain S-box protein [Rhodospirillales bacterium]